MQHKIYNPTVSNRWLIINIAFVVALSLISVGWHSALAANTTVETHVIDSVNVAPTVNAGADQIVPIHLSVTLNGSGNDPEGGTLLFQWTQTGGPAVSLTTTYSEGTSFVAPAISTVLTFTLTATDQENLTVSDTVVVSVWEVVSTPSALANADQIVNVATNVMLHGASFDPTYAVVSHRWTQTGGPTVPLNDADTWNPTFVAPGMPTVLTFTLTVTNAIGLSGSDDVVVTVTFNGCSNASGIPQPECAALVALYTNTQGTNWITKTGWLEDNTPCDWYGVTCSNGHVLYLQLPDNNLNGPLTPEIGNLAYLTVLNLDHNLLNGVLPSAIGKLAALQALSLNGDHLSGTLPATLGDLSQLTTLQLNANQFSGPIPTELGNLSNLQHLELYQNQLSGSIPSSLDNLTKLIDLQLQQNRLSGELPASLGTLTLLQTLQVQFNQLGGELPTSLLNLTNIGSGNLGLSENGFTASDPDLLAYLAVKAPAWEQWQTVPPANISFSFQANNTTDGGTLLWTPIRYQSNDGHYELSISDKVSGPYTVIAQTENKKVAEAIIKDLVPHKNYFVLIRSFTAKHEGQQNDLYSDYSDPFVLAVGKTAQVTIKIETPANDPSNLRLTSTFGDWWMDGVTDDGDTYGNSRSMTLAAGQYEIAEKLGEESGPNWLLINIECDPSSKATVDLDNFRVTFDVDVDASITCTFVHKDGSLGGDSEVYLPVIVR